MRFIMGTEGSRIGQWDQPDTYLYADWAVSVHHKQTPAVGHSPGNIKEGLVTFGGNSFACLALKKTFQVIGQII